MSISELLTFIERLYVAVDQSSFSDVKMATNFSSLCLWSS